MNNQSSPVILVLRQRAAFWTILDQDAALARILIHLIVFIILASALYGAVLAGGRETEKKIFPGPFWSTILTWAPAALAG